MRVSAFVLFTAVYYHNRYRHTHGRRTLRTDNVCMSIVCVCVSYRVFVYVCSVLDNVQ